MIVHLAYVGDSDQHVRVDISIYAAEAAKECLPLVPCHQFQIMPSSEVVNMVVCRCWAATPIPPSSMANGQGRCGLKFNKLCRPPCWLSPIWMLLEKDGTRMWQSSFHAAAEKNYRLHRIGN